ncbi:hypothetical protein BBJ28_00025046 [Nothophytophthora sp. Chile5]|nr:hypothetical protein BBJ28_00025046 [Nothophytophthora sp. Chile5]
MAAADEFNSLKCRYASKRCWNLRAIKRNGERHNLCEVHRQKANSNQRRLDKKRKAGQATLGLPTGLPLHAASKGFPDSERRMRMRASIAMKLERELSGAMPLTTQFIRPPPPTSLAELQRAAGAIDAARGGYTAGMDTWREASGLPILGQSAAWMHSSYPRSPRTMLRVAALAQKEAVMEPRGWMHHNPVSPPPPTPTASLLLPPIATAMARTGEGLISSATRQDAWQPERRQPTLVTRSNM